MNPSSSEASLLEFAQTLGRIEEKVSGIVSLDERVRKLEQTVERIEAKQVPKTPWWAVVGGLSGIGAFVMAVVFVLNLVVSK